MCIVKPGPVRAPSVPGPEIAGRGQAARRRPVETSADPGPEPLPPRPTLNSSLSPAPSWRRRRESSRRPTVGPRRLERHIPAPASPGRAACRVLEVPRSNPALLRDPRVPWLTDGGPCVVHPIYTDYVLSTPIFQLSVAFSGISKRRKEFDSFQRSKIPKLGIPLPF